ncbi:diacylglycerol kinase family protein [Inquilinus sp. YAF38]|uniref:diacylglycerol/lipid kinase family protein n=1 Tax=Inquilinus sp. YAF38 TaxID=3233084 RepID=UPI003F8E894B
MEVSLFHNPKAGDGDWPADKLVRLLEMSGFAPVHCSTRSKELEKALENPHDLVVIAGGDGAVAEIVRALHGRSHTVVILPTGSSNNIARALGIVEEPRHIVAGLAKAKRTPLRIGVVEGPEWSRNFVEAVGMGPLVAAIEQGAAGGKEHGSDLLGERREDLRRIVADCEPLDVSIAVDGKPLDEKMLMLEVMNLPMIGPNLLLAPEADPGDAHLDVAWLPAAKRRSMLAWLKDPEARGSPLQRIRAEQVKLHPRGGSLHVDDKAVEGGEATLTIRIEPKPVTVLITGGEE